MLDATQVNVPPPLLVIVRDWAAGTALPVAYWKLKVVGDTANAAGAADTTSVTVTVAGLLDAPVAVIVMLPVYVPALRDVGSTDTLTVEGALPDAESIVSQDALVLTAAVHASVPDPLLVIDRD